jgi:hypothetical protein
VPHRSWQQPEKTTSEGCQDDAIVAEHQGLPCQLPLVVQPIEKGRDSLTVLQSQFVSSWLAELELKLQQTKVELDRK